MIAGYIKTYDEYTASKTVSRSNISLSTIKYLKEHGFTCKLLIVDGYEDTWCISKDEYQDGGVFAVFRNAKN
jgi:hypothetical protein